jgi:hypothetical protein
MKSKKKINLKFFPKQIQQRTTNKNNRDNLARLFLKLVKNPIKSK